MMSNDPILTGSRFARPSGPRDTTETLLETWLDALIERIDALCEIFIMPVVSVVRALAVGTVRTLNLAFSPAAPATRSSSVPSLLRYRLRGALSLYGDALGSLIAITLVAALCAAPLVVLSDIGAEMIPSGSLSRHPLVTAATRLLVEVAFYYPLLTLGVGRLSRQRADGEPVRPFQCIRLMAANLPGLLRTQGLIAVLPLIMIPAIMIATARMGLVTSIVVLSFILLWSYWWLARNVFVVPTRILTQTSPVLNRVRITGNGFVLLTLVLSGVTVARAGIAFTFGSLGETDPFWHTANQWVGWACCVSTRVVDPFVCFVLVALCSSVDLSDASFRRTIVSPR
jgi:hypothetical protein